DCIRWSISFKIRSAAAESALDRLPKLGALDTCALEVDDMDAAEVDVDALGVDALDVDAA
ncbi:MAG: hypothetical protein ACKN9M_10155, partial [Burkholderiaceae bacterium]